MTKLQSSEKVKEFIKKAQVVGFATWQDTGTAEVVQRLQRANDESRYLIGQLRHFTVEKVIKARMIYFSVG